MTSEREALADAARALRLAVTMLERAGALPIAVHPVEEAMRRAERAAELAGVRLGSGSESQCPDRCGGIVGHAGPHQSSDYVSPSELVRIIRGRITPGNEHGLTYQAGRNDGLRVAADLVADRLTGATEPTPDRGEPT